jgi:hypothetical protein
MRENLGKISEAGPFGQATCSDSVKTVPDCSQNRVERKGQVYENRWSDQGCYDTGRSLVRLIP